VFENWKAMPTSRSVVHKLVAFTQKLQNAQAQDLQHARGGGWHGIDGEVENRVGSRWLHKALGKSQVCPKLVGHS
jgi:hypothetical protein